jgi:hypothetical protein
MRQQQLDDLLAAALGEAFHLPQGVEDALWEGFTRRRSEDRKAWRAFGDALLLGNLRLRAAISRSAWPAAFQQNLAWR